MTANKKFYIWYGNNQAVKLKMHVIREDIGNVVATIRFLQFLLQIGLFENTWPLTLHITVDALPGNFILILIDSSFGIYDNPLIITNDSTVMNDIDNQILIKNKRASVISSKSLYFSDLVDSTENLVIPFDVLPWGQRLIKSMDDKLAVLLHGYWQSGKPSALRFL